MDVCAWGQGCGNECWPCVCIACLIPSHPALFCRRFAERQWLKRNTFFGKTNQEVEAIKKKLAHH